MLRTIGMTMAALLLTACASGPTDRGADMAAALQQVQTEDYAGSERCLSPNRYATVEVLDDQHLLFEGRSGGEVWLNTLRNRCPGLRPDDVLAFELHGNRLCALDTATVMERFLFWRRTGPTCSLGEFQKLNEGQAQLVRDAL